MVDFAGGDAARDLTARLRAAGLRADRAFDGRSPKAQFKAADRSGARLALVVGPDEAAAGRSASRTSSPAASRSPSPPTTRGRGAGPARGRPGLPLTQPGVRAPPTTGVLPPYLATGVLAPPSPSPPTPPATAPDAGRAGPRPHPAPATHPAAPPPR